MNPRNRYTIASETSVGLLQRRVSVLLRTCPGWVVVGGPFVFTDRTGEIHFGQAMFYPEPEVL